MPPAPPSASELLALEPVETYKHDARSRVWRVDHSTGSFVIKRFEYSPLRQGLGQWLHLHPAGQEQRAAAWLAQLDIPVVPLLRSGWSQRKRCLVTPTHGPSLQHTLRHAPPAGHPRLLAAVAPLVRQLIDQRVFFKDLKASNIVLGPNAPDTLDPKLIDTGSARRGLSPTQRQRMLDMLHQTCQDAGASHETVGRCLRFD
ncbi:MAG: hypothetical protein AAFY08_07035 [Planctomycetota bacterium]